ncbi:MAG: isoleucine--tRNA ligase [Candidatus Eisenbacteria bacterium]|nr:isoleucine--tRNA ligase [Candidatus Latescibacterota bacterium]MBD3300926.1 isoleucine--tRNA ligase [Candidatus Eisenbacteria bacterium]
MADKKNVYKDTLNLPRTAFDMRAGLLKKEPAIQEKWRNDGLYHRIRQARKGAPRFLLHDGPPYANGNIHMGTGLNKVLKDIVVRVKTMTGHDSRYLPGWDCHGLPIEQRVLDELGRAAAGMEPMEIRKRCHDYAARFAKLQSEQFQRLGVLGEFEEPYITMDPAYEADTIEVFARLIERNVVYRQLKPVHWSIENKTALADAELEYHDRDDLSIYVALPIDGKADGIPHRPGDSIRLMVWTTTPWTLPANEAVAVHPKFAYAAVHAETKDGPMTFLVAEDLLATVAGVLGGGSDPWLSAHEVVGRITGAELLEIAPTYAHPIHPGKSCPVVPALYVTLDQGTGLVHTAPGHGAEDYATGRSVGLPINCPVREDGTFDETVPEWLRGVLVWDANTKILERLGQDRLLAHTEKIRHSYPHDWRSKGPTIFRATKQWFISVDRDLADGGASLRARALDVCGRDKPDGGVEFIPGWGRSRILGMLESRPDWCISRQRAWGLPIPVFYNEDGDPLLTQRSVRAVAAAFRQHGSNSWFTLSPDQLLPGYAPEEDPDLEAPDRFPIGDLTPGRDIFDVWFESGSSWYSAAIGRGLTDRIPVDLYLEGSDQHRGWFQLSLLPALGTQGVPPYETVLTHGFVVTEDGHKMSKSLGNAIDIIEQLQKRGADILRLWSASQNYHDDIRCSESLIAQSEDAYRKIRNTLRFLMGSCNDFDPARHAVPSRERSLDHWMRMELHRMIRDVRRAYDGYEFHKAARLIYEFCTVEASSIYLAAVKDRLYCEAPDAPRRRASQTVIHETLVALVKLLAPIIPHTCDEAWGHIPALSPDEPDNVHLALLPDPDDALVAEATDPGPSYVGIAAFSKRKGDPGAAWIWRELFALRTSGLLKLEGIRNSGVKDPLDTEAVFHVASRYKSVETLLEEHITDLEDLLGVGYARVDRVDKLDYDAAVLVRVVDTREMYPRCARSWKRRPDVGSDPDFPDLSARDAAAVRTIREAREHGEEGSQR